MVSKDLKKGLLWNGLMTSIIVGVSLLMKLLTVI
jgi:hypothetical protein